MARRVNRYRILEKNMTFALLGDLALFILYLLFSSLGIIWLKVILAIFSGLLSLAILGYLYLSQELLRRRSLWMTTGGAAILLCLLVSLILNYPAP